MNQKEERTTCLVPITMLPNKKTFMDLGFAFQVIPNSDLCLATLPAGWKSVADEDFWVNLIDENGCDRGSYIYTSTGNNFIDLKTRFYLSVEFDPDDSTKALRYVWVKDRGTNGRVVFSSGTCASEDSYKINILNLKAKNFLNEHYPDWENPSAYWDLDKKDIQYWCQ